MASSRAPTHRFDAQAEHLLDEAVEELLAVESR